MHTADEHGDENKKVIYVGFWIFITENHVDFKKPVQNFEYIVQSPISYGLPFKLNGRIRELIWFFMLDQLGDVSYLDSLNK